MITRENADSKIPESAKEAIKVLNSCYIVDNTLNADINEREKASLGSLLIHPPEHFYIQPRHINAEVVPYSKIEFE